MRSDAGPARGKGAEKQSCQCPFCDAPVEEALPFCKACGRTIRRCPKCGRVLAATEIKCPKCKD